MGLHPFIGSGVPQILPGYSAWYDASSSGSVLDGTGHQCTDGVAVTNWKDLSANAFDLTGVNTLPVFYSTTSANLIGGKPVVYFITGDGGMLSATFARAQPLTVYCVFRSTDAAALQFLWSNTSTSPQCRLYLSGGYNLDCNSTTITGGTNDTTAHTSVAVANGASSLVRIDGTQVVSGSPGTGSITNGFGLSRGPTGGSPVKGPIGEFILYAAAHTLAQMQQNEAYLKAKWGTP